MKYNPKIVVAYFKECGLPSPDLEYRFCGDRKWRFDFAWTIYRHPDVGSQVDPYARVALEVEGGIYIRKGHASIQGIKRDIEKYNAATCLGWRVLRVTPENLCMQETVDMVKICLRL